MTKNTKKKGTTQMSKKKSTPRTLRSLKMKPVSGGTRNLVKNRPFRARSYLRSVNSREDGSIVLVGREVLQEVNTSQGFTKLLDQPINPANFSLFPRLASVATAFEKYRFNALHFHFVNGCNGTTPGSILHYIDYDPADGSSPDAVSLLANESAMVSAVTLDNSVVLNPKHCAFSTYFINQSTTTPSAAAELRQDNVGAYRIFMDKGGATQNFAGYIYTEYEIELYTPVPTKPVSITAQFTTPSVSDSGGTARPCAQTVLSDEGIIPQTPTGSAYAGIQGTVDAIKTAYRAGQYAYSIINAVTAATAAVDIHELGFTNLGRTNPRLVTGRTGKGLKVELKEDPLSPLTAGDINIGITIYDVTAGNIDPAFPSSQNGMTFVTAINQPYDGIGTTATTVDSAGLFTVPTGKLYMISPYFQTDSTTQRTLIPSGSYFALSRASAS